MKSIACLATALLLASTAMARPVEGAYTTALERPIATVVMDLGGTGQKVLFVEVASSKQQCLCDTAKAMAAYAHSRIIKVGDDDPAQIALQNYLQNNVAGNDQICIVASANTYESCKAALAALRDKPTLVLYDATANLVLGAAPDTIAVDVINFIAENAEATTGSAVSTDKPRGDRWWYVP